MGTIMEFCLLTLVIVSAYCQDIDVSVYEEQSPDGYITYRNGNMPLIISVPHGGYSKPSDITDRHNGCRIDGQCVYSHTCGEYSSRCRCPTSRDTSTREIADRLWREIFKLTSTRPHLIMNELHRSKLDANRALDEATFGDEKSKMAYGNYTLFIQKARTLIGLHGDGRGLFLDMHGQSHSEEWTELGYRLTTEELNARAGRPVSSISALHSRTCGSEPCMWDLINGQHSLGRFLSDKGYKVVPSPSFPSPGSGKYYRGGYNTDTYGSEYCGNIDAIQIETPRSIRFGDWETYAVDLAEAVVGFMALNGYI